MSADAMYPMTSFFLAMTGSPCSHAFWAYNAMHTHYIILLLVLHVVQIVHMGNTCTLLCCLGVTLVYSVGVITDIVAYW